MTRSDPKAGALAVSARIPDGARQERWSEEAQAVEESKPQSAFSSDKQKALSRQLAELETLDASGLRLEWRRLFRADAPQVSRDLILRALAYRLQERVHGGLSKSAKRQLAVLVRELRQDADEATETSMPTPIRPGARLVREWRGRTHIVLVTERGFEYAGGLYASLTMIAREITGAHWSGPRFFGLRSKRRNAQGGDPKSTRPALLRQTNSDPTPAEMPHG